MEKARLKVTYALIEDLKPSPHNTRKHSKKQVSALARAIKEFGWTNPIVVDEAGTVLAGHCRLEAAKTLQLDTVPTIRIADLSEVQRRAYIIADNRLGEVGSAWDRKLLASEYESMRLLDPVLDLSVTGFELEEIDLILDAALETPPEPCAVPARGERAVTVHGDVWLLGTHRVICGDTRDPSTFDRLLGDERPTLVYAGTPYNVPVNGHMVRRGRHREFLMASGELTDEDYQLFLNAVVANLVRYSSSGSIHYLFIDWRHLRQMLAAAQQYHELKNIICWNKLTAGLGAFYRSQHEFVLVTKNGNAAHINNFRLGENGRHRTNVWSYQGLNGGWDAERRSQLEMHPTVQPVDMVADALKDCSRKRAIVLDPFGGSGTTLIAAEQTGRRARLIELDPLYVDVCIRRWESITGQFATHAESGLRFVEAAER